MNRHALFYQLAPGADQRAVEVARACRWPVGRVAGPTRLVACTVFHRDGLLIRMLDIDGAVDTCLHGLAAGPAVVRAESRLAALLVSPARVRDEADIRGLHAGLSAPRVAGRFTDPGLLPTGRVAATNRAALVYPVRAGHGADLQAVLSGGRGLPVQASATTVLASTAVFRRDDLVVRLVEVAGDIDAGFAHLRATATRSPAAGRLAALLEPGYDLRTEAGFSRFLATGAMALVTDDRASDAAVPSTSELMEGRP